MINVLFHELSAEFPETPAFVARSFDVAQQGNPAQRPVLRIEVRLKVNGAHVFLVGALRLPINRALVQPRILAGRRIYGVNVDDRHLLVQHLRP